MDCKNLKKGDIFRVVRNSREYKVLVPYSVNKSRDFLAECREKKNPVAIHAKIEVVMVKEANNGS